MKSQPAMAASHASAPSPRSRSAPLRAHWTSGLVRVANVVDDGERACGHGGGSGDAADLVGHARPPPAFPYRLRVGFVARRDGRATRSATVVTRAAAAAVPRSTLPWRPFPGTSCFNTLGMTIGASSEPTPMASDVAVSAGV